MNTSQRLTEQIEDIAGYYSPEIYDLLTFHNSMFETAIEDATDYFPLTATKLSDAEIIPFVIGVIPPSAQISGRLLDRSATLGGPDAYEGMTYEVFDVETLGLIEGALAASRGSSGYKGGGRIAPRLPAGAPSPGVLPPGVKIEVEPLPRGAVEVARVNTPMTPAQVHAAFTAAYRALGYGEPPGNFIDMLVTQSSIETNFWKSTPNFNFSGVKGRGRTKQTVRSWTWEYYKTKNGTPENPEGKTRVWGAFAANESATDGGKTYVGTVMNSRYRAAIPYAIAGDAANYARELAKAGYYTADPEEYARSMSSRYAQFSGGRYKGQADVTGLTIKAVLSGGTSSAVGGGGGRRGRGGRGGGGGISRPAAETLWSASGKKKAMDAARAEIAASNKDAGKVTAFTDANLGALGQKYAAAQEQLVAYLRDEQTRMYNTPPLQFLINPQSFSISESKIVTDGNWARNGPGRVAGFYAASLNPDDKSGLSRSKRSFTLSYHNLMSAYLIYRNNGSLWSFEDISRARDMTARPDQLALVGSIYIYYDSTLYIGSFNSFQLTEEAEAPFAVSYTFEFVARQVANLDRNYSVMGDYPLFDPFSNPFGNPSGQGLPPDTIVTDGAFA